MNLHTITFNTESGYGQLEATLPAACKVIKGIYATAEGLSSDEGSELGVIHYPLVFPEQQIRTLLNTPPIAALDFVALLSQPDAASSKLMFETTNYLGQIKLGLDERISYRGETLVHDTNYDADMLSLQVSSRMISKLDTDLANYLFDDNSFYQSQNPVKDFQELLIKLLFEDRENIFHRNRTETLPIFKPHFSGVLSLLLNGHRFLLRDFPIRANVTNKGLPKLAVPFNEPIDINTTINGLYKPLGDLSELKIRIYILY